MGILTGVTTMNGNYKTQLSVGSHAGASMLLLSVYQAGMTTAQLFDDVLSRGVFPMLSASRIKIIVRSFMERFSTDSAAVHLKQLSQFCGYADTLQIMFFHHALSDPALADFVSNVYWTKCERGNSVINSQNAKWFLEDAVSLGHTQKRWASSTINSMASGLMGCCYDYGLLYKDSDGGSNVKYFSVNMVTAFYIVYWLHFNGYSDNAIVNHKIWSVFSFNANSVHSLLQRLSSHGLIILQSAGGAVCIGKPFKSMDEVIEQIRKEVTYV